MACRQSARESFRRHSFQPAIPIQSFKTKSSPTTRNPLHPSNIPNSNMMNVAQPPHQDLFEQKQQNPPLVQQQEQEQLLVNQHEQPSNVPITPRSRNPAIRQQLMLGPTNQPIHPPDSSSKPTHTISSLEQLNIQEFGSNILMIRRKRSHASIRGSPVRQFFLRLFRRSSRPKYFYNKAQLTRRPTRPSTALIRNPSPQSNSPSLINKPKGKINQYRFRPLQLFNPHPYPLQKNTPPLPTRTNAISSPLHVTKYVGIDPTGSPELLSIKSHHSSGALRIHAISGQPVSDNNSPASVYNPDLVSRNGSVTSLQLGPHVDRYRRSYIQSQRMPRDVLSRQTDLENTDFDLFSDVGAGITGAGHSRGPSNTTDKHMAGIADKDDQNNDKHIRVSESSGYETLDALDLRLELLQRDLDEARRIKRRMTGSTRRSRRSALPEEPPQPASNRLSSKRSLTSSRSSLYRRPSVAKARSIISIASSIASLSNPSLIAGNAAAAAAITSANVARHASNASSRHSYNHPAAQRTQSQHRTKPQHSRNTSYPTQDSFQHRDEINYENVIKRSDIHPSGSLNPGVETEPVSDKKLFSLDKDGHNDPIRVEEALAFVNTWSSYLRRAIAVRIVLRQEMQELEQHKLQREHAWEDVDTKTHHRHATYPATQYPIYRTHSERQSAPPYHYNYLHYRPMATTVIPSQHRQNYHVASSRQPHENHKLQTPRHLRNPEEDETESYSGETASVSSYLDDGSSSNSGSPSRRTSGQSSAFAAYSGKYNNIPSSSPSKQQGTFADAQPRQHAADPGLSRNQSVSFRDPRDTRDTRNARRFTIATTSPSLESEYSGLDEERFKDLSSESFEPSDANESSNDYSSNVGNESMHSGDRSQINQPISRVHPLHPHSQEIGPYSYSRHAIRKPSQSSRVRRFRSNTSLSDGDEPNTFEDAISNHPHLHSAVLAMAAGTSPIKSQQKRTPSSIRRSLKNGDIETRYATLMSSRALPRNTGKNSSYLFSPGSAVFDASRSSLPLGSPSIIRNPLRANETRNIPGNSVQRAQVFPGYITKRSRDHLVGDEQYTEPSSVDHDSVSGTNTQGEAGTRNSSGSEGSSSSIAASFIAPLPGTISRPPLKRNKSNMSTESSVSSAADTVASTETYSTPGKETMWMRSSFDPATASSKNRKPFHLKNNVNFENKDVTGLGLQMKSGPVSADSEQKSLENGEQDLLELPQLLPAFATEQNGSPQSEKSSSSTVQFVRQLPESNSRSTSGSTSGSGDKASQTQSESISVDDRSGFNSSQVSDSISESDQERGGNTNFGGPTSPLASIIHQFSPSVGSSTTSLPNTWGVVDDRSDGTAISNPHSAGANTEPVDVTVGPYFANQPIRNIDSELADIPPTNDPEIIKLSGNPLSASPQIGPSSFQNDDSGRPFHAYDSDGNAQTPSISVAGPSQSQHGAHKNSPNISDAASSSKQVGSNSKSSTSPALVNSTNFTKSTSSTFPTVNPQSRNNSPNLEFIPKSASTSSVVSGGSSGFSSTRGIPKILREQREISDRILEDMVQEMEELEQRSTFLLAKSQRQFTKLSGDEGAFSPVPSSVSHTPIVGRNLSSSTLSLKDGSPLMHGSSFAPGFVPVPSSTSSSGSSSVPVSEDTIPLVISTQSAGPAYTLPGSISSPITPSKLVATSGSFSAANSPSDHSSPVSTGNNSSGSGSGSSGASAIRLKYSMRRASVGSVGNSNQSSSSSGGQSRPTSVTKSSLQPQYPTQYATTNTHVSSLSGSLNSATVDSLAPISIRSPHANSDTFSSAGNLKMKFATTSSQGNVATTTQGSVPLPQRPIGAISPDSSVGRPAENSIIPLESGEPYAGNTYQLNSGLQQLPEGNAESDDEAIIVNVKQSSANSPLLSNVYNAFAPTTGTRISTVAEMTEPSSLSGSSPTSGGSQESLKKEAKPAEIKTEEDDEVQITKVSRSSSLASSVTSSFYSSTHYSDSSPNLTALNPPRGGVEFIQPSSFAASSFGANPLLYKLPSRSRDSLPISLPLHPQKQVEVYDIKGKGFKRVASTGSTKRLSQLSEHSQSSEHSGSQASSDSSQFSVVPPIKSSARDIPGTSYDYVLDSPTAGSFPDLSKHHSSDKKSSSSVSLGAAKTHDFPGLHYQPSYNSISSNRSTSSAAGGLGNDSSNASRNSLIPRDSASPVPRHIPTEDDALISETAAALSSSRIGNSAGPSGLSRGKPNRRRDSPSKRHSTGNASIDSVSSSSVSPIRRDGAGHSRNKSDFRDSDTERSETSSSDSILPLPPMIVPGALPLYLNRRRDSSSPGLHSSSSNSASTPARGNSPSDHVFGSNNDSNMFYSTPPQGSAASSLASHNTNQIDGYNFQRAVYTPIAGVSAVSAAAAANAVAINAANATGIDASGSFYSLASTNSPSHYYDARQGNSSPNSRGSPVHLGGYGGGHAHSPASAARLDSIPAPNLVHYGHSRAMVQHSNRSNSSLHYPAAAGVTLSTGPLGHSGPERLEPGMPDPESGLESSSPSSSAIAVNSLAAGVRKGSFGST